MKKTEKKNKRPKQAMQKDMSTNFFRNHKAVIWSTAFIIAILTFIVYLPALSNGFVNWDDDIYVYANGYIRNIDLNFFKWAFTSVVQSSWHPLTLLSYALDFSVWQLNPKGYHLTNNLLHSLNTFLIFILALVLILQWGKKEKEVLPLKALVAAGTTAILFGIHPLHVESVVWISERKDVLSAFFFLLTLLAYLKYVSSEKSKGTFFYVISLLFFSLSLMSKAMAVTLPFVLLILDYFPLKRLMAEGNTMNLKGIIIEKIPFLILTVLTCVVTLWAQGLGGAIKNVESFPVVIRVFVACKAYFFYIAKMILPVNLSPFYPHPAMSKSSVFAVEYWIAIVLFVVFTLGSILWFKKRQLFSAVWFYYVITLLPVIGLVHIGGHAAADRYTYIPAMSLFLLVGLGVGTLFEKRAGRPAQLVLIGIVFLLVLTLLSKKTVQQADIWKDSISLWSHEIRLYPDQDPLPYYNRGNAYEARERYKQSIEDYSSAIEIQPYHYRAYNNRGIVYGILGKLEKALSDFNKVIEIDNNYADGYSNRGAAYHRLGRLNLAIEDYEKAIRLNPQDTRSMYNLGLIYSDRGQESQSLTYFKMAGKLGLREAQEYLGKQ